MFRTTAAAGVVLVWGVSLAWGAAEVERNAIADGPQASHRAEQSLSSSAPAPAQPAGTASPALRAVRGRTRPSLDDRVKTLTARLGLNEAQQSAVKKILEQRQEETLRLRLDPSIPASLRIDFFRAIQEKTVERIRSVLDDEQRKKYDPLAPRRLPPSPDQRTVEDWIQATRVGK